MSRSRILPVLSLLGVALACPPQLIGQPSNKVATAIRSKSAPRVDGVLDDEVWKSARPVDDFTQQRPVPGAAPSERTVVYFLYDDQALYVGARMFRQRPELIVRNLTRRDGTGNAERLTITMDPQRDRRTGVGFGVSAAGVRSDFRHTQDEDMRGRENQYDPVWAAAAHIDSIGWTAEMRIPFSQLRFPVASEQQWGLEIDRWIPDKNEDLQWVMIPPSETGYISRFGTLAGLAGVKATRPVEFLPYVAGDATRRATATVANPFNHPYAGRVGADAKAAVFGNLTLDATINPDFGQVEADPAEVNLSAFETFFDERRPFFVEGSEMLRGNGAQYFYPRRIGAAPHVSVSGDFVDVPRSSTILGASKLTGRLPSRTTVGVLSALTASENARVRTIEPLLTTTMPVEPRTAYGLVRVQQEIGRQASTLGVSLTGTHRNMAGSSALTAALVRNAYFGGADWRLRFQQGKYAISGFVAGSYVAGDTAALRRLQTNSTRFLQRPDLTHVRYDPLRRSMGGYSAQIRADKDAGRRILWGAELKVESAGFEINDLGRMQSVDDIEYNADIQIRETLPQKYLRNWRLGFDTRGSRNLGGVHQQSNFAQNTTVTFNNFWNLNVRSSIDLRAVDDALTRGGPLMGKPREFRQDLRLNSRIGGQTFWRVNGGYDTDEFGATRRNVGGQVTVRPSDRVSLSVEPSWSSGVDPRQYVTRVAGGTRTYDNRYIFGSLDRTTISTKLRLNYTFSPNLTLEGYGEPFLSSGHYGQMGELLAPRSRLLRAYGTDGTTETIDSTGTRAITDGESRFTVSNRDFRVLSFRSNVVMRWEWRPGSTLFVVWQQNRRTSENYVRAVRVADLLNTTRAAGDNFLSVKFSHWLPVSFGGR